MKGNNVTKQSKTGKQREKKRVEKLAAKKQKGEKMKQVLASLAAMEKANLNVNTEMNEKRANDLRSSKHMKRETKETRKRKERPKPDKEDIDEEVVSSESEDDNYNPYATVAADEGIPAVNER